MDRTALQEIIRKGRNARVEFQRDDVPSEQLARQMTALLNAQGGRVLLGVEDDGTVTGLTRDVRKVKEWVMETGCTQIQPSTAPAWDIAHWDADTRVGIVCLPAHAPDTPYKVQRDSTWGAVVRVGSKVRDATRREELRLYQQSGQLRYERNPVLDASWHDLDKTRLKNYFSDVRGQDCPALQDRDAWVQWLVNADLLVNINGLIVPNVGSMLLFGSRPRFMLSQAGINAAAYAGRQKEYAPRARALIKAPIVSLYASAEEGRPALHLTRSNTFSDYVALPHVGVVEQALDFVRRNTDMQAGIDRSGRRQERWSYAYGAVREAVANAVAHRDYTYAEQDIELTLYSDRLEIISPGRLPNAMTVEKMRAGHRHRTARNEFILNVLRDYRYVEAAGLGVARKIVKGMRDHNGTEPDLIEEEDRFIVRLWQGIQNKHDTEASGAGWGDT